MEMKKFGDRLDKHLFKIREGEVKYINRIVKKIQSCFTYHDFYIIAYKYHENLDPNMNNIYRLSDFKYEFAKIKRLISFFETEGLCRIIKNPQRIKGKTQMFGLKNIEIHYKIMEKILNGDETNDTR